MKDETTTHNQSTPNHNARLLRSTLWGAALALGLAACGGSGPGTGTPVPPRPCGSCLSYEQCSTSGTCAVNPNSTWFFAADSARIASTKVNGDAWDVFGGAPDPFVRLDGRQTTVKQDTFTPTWQEGATYTATNLLNQGVTVQVIDDDVSNPDPIGGPTVVRPTEADLRAGILVVQNLGQAQSITFTLTPR